MLSKIVTVGVYGFTAQSFFLALQRAGVDTVCDIRRRRSVRGREYAFANRRRLEMELAALGIRYVHRLDLAPGPELREQQQRIDEEERIAKRQRVRLSPAFIEAYQRQCLGLFDAHRFVVELGDDARVVAFLCVETVPSACHRALVAEWLSRKLDLPVEHLFPPIGP
ncbi:MULTISPECIES: DUF488 domain-containing protein [Caldilinea]|jgi:uncharacterized protein (DUF488 family)|uniref:DUF488 domain-containing protein n=1 Tax=Caldilinea aerophila (strain DSM 14535 / JCM 11387 / NBRC 104270 / STL-6-O1) TaxID=926550 RepID=I0HZ68_CALAS|nr:MULTISPECIES: DUF488 domain-containing protein [Caldilinea]BAL98305.1 hypothetical protein CLDAP_02660 [Caldilinea aerophila DSM 14535 = NBRC 104270]GIV75105.1 MAG: hypothetical protein KatS3mg049_3661 [Caldilinea sp.]